MTAAFQRLGHEVRHIGNPMGHSIWGMEVDARHEWTPDLLDGVWTPDLKIVLDSDPGILNAFHHWTADAPVVYGVDNHVREYRRPHLTHYFLAHHDGHAQPVRKPDESWLPCGYDPTLHTPSPIPYLDRQYDVAMIGVMYNHRRAVLNELRAAGLKVLAGTGLLYEDYVNAYHNARISLCLSFNGDVAQRVFETAAMGNMVISDDCDDYPRLRPRGLHSAPQRFLVDRVRMFVADAIHAQDCITESLEWVKIHTWDNRASQIIQWVEAHTEGILGAGKVGEAFYATTE